MRKELPESYKRVLACPHCGGALTYEAEEMSCTACGARYPRLQSGAFDLRLRSAKQHTVEFTVGTPPVPDDFSFEPLEINPQAELDVPGSNVPWHFSRELLSYFPKSKAQESFALDLGCGSGLHQALCEYAGFNWVGVDYGNPAAPLQGDGHALPFGDRSFDLVFSMAVLEHIRYPFVFGQEVLRVLKPGGMYIGTVAFLEPFHGDSFYHHTHLGTYNTLSTCGFEVLRVGPTRSWSGLHAQATMGGLFPRIPNGIGHAIVWPLEMLHKLWWWAGGMVSKDAGELRRLLTNTGSFEFVARKPE